MSNTQTTAQVQISHPDFSIAAHSNPLAGSASDSSEAPQQHVLSVTTSHPILNSLFKTLLPLAVQLLPLILTGLLGSSTPPTPTPPSS